MKAKSTDDGNPAHGRDCLPERLMMLRRMTSRRNHWLRETEARIDQTLCNQRVYTSGLHTQD